jgi:hypothetical protein
MALLYLFRRHLQEGFQEDQLQHRQWPEVQEELDQFPKRPSYRRVAWVPPELSGLSALSLAVRCRAVRQSAVQTAGQLALLAVLLRQSHHP